MEIFLLVIVILILLSTRSKVNDKNNQLNDELKKLKAELLFIKNQIANLSKQAPDKETQKSSTHNTEEKKSTQDKVVEEPPIIKQNFTPPKPMFIVDEMLEEEKTITPTEPKTSVKLPIEEPIPIAAIYNTIEDPPKFTPPKNTKKEKSFMEKNPDLEKFIGENLVNKIGIAILVLGIGYFVKFAIDKDWINEIGRVAIGILCGGILIGLAHRLRKEFTAFSSVLVGGGIAVLYFTISLAFHDYHLFSQTLAFAMMVIVTAFAVLLSVAYDRVELAILAIIGGFGSPFFVSTGQGNHIVLFTYLLVLNGGMLSLAYFKKWNVVNVICYVFTILIFGGWLFSKYDYDRHSTLIVLLFALSFYIVFFAMNIVYNIKNKLPFQTLELSILLSNTFLFFSTGIHLLNHPALEDYKGIFTIAMGLFNLGFAYPLYKRGDTDKNLIFVLIGLVLTFISLAAPIQLKGHHITLFWAAEMVLLLWLSQKSGVKLIKQTAVLLTGLLLISLILDWFNYYADGTAYLRPFANKAFITSMFTLIALMVKYNLLKKENPSNFYDAVFALKEYQILIQAISAVLLYLSLLLEIVHQTQYYYNDQSIRNIIVVCYHATFVLVLISFYTKQNLLQFNKVKLALLCLSILMILLCNSSIIDIRNQVIKSNAPLQLFFFLHFYIITIGCYFTVKLHQTLKTILTPKALEFKYIYWLTVILLIVIASIELDHLVVYSLTSKYYSSSYLLSQNHKFGYAILWGAAAFILINVGLKRKIREIRIISLALFSLVILKLFAYDINNISEAGRIVAFVLLGVLLLVVSFMYQRLKKLISADQTYTENENENTTEAN
jgi:uncharacterized membrane protein